MLCLESKQHIEFSKLAEVMETKGLKTLRDVKTCRLSMVSPLKRVMSEYMTLIQKMAEDAKDATSPHVAKAYCNLLVDIFVPIAMSCFLPLLEIAILQNSCSKVMYLFVITLRQ